MYRKSVLYLLNLKDPKLQRGCKRKWDSNGIKNGSPGSAGVSPAKLSESALRLFFIHAGETPNAIYF